MEDGSKRVITCKIRVPEGNKRKLVVPRSQEFGCLRDYLGHGDDMIPVI